MRKVSGSPFRTCWSKVLKNKRSAGNWIYWVVSLNGAVWFSLSSPWARFLTAQLHCCCSDFCISVCGVWGRPNLGHGRSRLHCLSEVVSCPSNVVFKASGADAAWLTCLPCAEIKAAVRGWGASFVCLFGGNLCLQRNKFLALTWSLVEFLIQLSSFYEEGNFMKKEIFAVFLPWRWVKLQILLIKRVKNVQIKMKPFHHPQTWNYLITSMFHTTARS